MMCQGKNEILQKCRGIFTFQMYEVCQKKQTCGLGIQLQSVVEISLKLAKSEIGENPIYTPINPVSRNPGTFFFFKQISKMSYFINVFNINMT